MAHVYHKFGFANPAGLSQKQALEDDLCDETLPFDRESLWELLAKSLGLCGDPSLVAPHCAIPRDYLSDTLILHAMRFLPFAEPFPLREHAK